MIMKKLTFISTLLLLAMFSLQACGSSVTEEDTQKAEEAAHELEHINYDSITMPEATEEDAEDEEFDAESMLD